MAGRLRFEGGELEELLDRVRREVGPHARVVAANRVRQTGIARFFTRDEYEVVVDLVDHTDGIEPEPLIDLAAEPPATVSTERADFGTVIANLTRELDDEDSSIPALLVDDDPVVSSAHVRVAGARALPVLPAPVVVPEPDPRLLALGLPVDYAPSTAATGDVHTALRQRLSQLPPPPVLTRTTGVVIAIVGIGAAPIAFARRLADELDVGPDHVLLATPEPMSDLSAPDEAYAFRRSCRRRTEPTVVACSIGPGRTQLAWAKRILDRLEPTITWVVVDASVKPEDIEHRVDLLGGVDVIALTGIADTVSPAAILRLGIPVGRIDSHRATPAVWADLLLERLER